MSLTPRFVALMFMSFALCVAGDAEAQNTKNKAQTSRPSVPTESALRARINEWTVGLAGGLIALERLQSGGTQQDVLRSGVLISELVAQLVPA